MMQHKKKYVFIDSRFQNKIGFLIIFLFSENSHTINTKVNFYKFEVFFSIVRLSARDKTYFPGINLQLFF